ncbi:Mur ligase middle domain protein [Evansella cellulosilytica DSM 2522]|uniref:Mur ligase middle domain protein n=2 Tax=Evansella TaxID=2837485 RepID=E6TWB8_EVAC2|nr:Mur ligase middle domain protein [Evansella cellulosilytica DSM 2522]
MKPIIPRVPAVGVTGSAGKSSTTSFINAIFNTRWKNVLTTKGNMNLPKHTKQAVSQFNRNHKAIVLEMGLGRASNHFNYIQPNIGVITNVGTAHYGKLGNSIKETAKAKSAMIRNIHPRGILLLNNDDTNSKLLDYKNFKGDLIRVGITSKSEYQATNIKYTSYGMIFGVTLRGKKVYFFIPAFGMHNVINALFAIAIADRLNFSINEMKLGLRSCKSPSRRVNVIKLSKPKGALLIDDTFNANPQSVKAAVDVLAELGNKKKKIAVLGSMLELGDYSKKGHQEVGAYLAKKGIKHVFLYGKNASYVKTAAIENGIPEKNILHTTNRDKLHYGILRVLNEGCVVLIKGSHKMKMSRTAEYIARNSLKK